jgi:probable HAF family extracellular repeat protein
MDIRHIAVVAAITSIAWTTSIAKVNVGSQTCSYTLFTIGQGSTPGLGGINDLDVVSGSVQQGQTMYGFIRKPSGTVTTFLINGHSNLTSKINNNDVVVGSYYPSQTSPQAGFRRSASGAVKTLAVPNGANGTAAHGINNSGEIVGWYDTANAVQKGFIYKSGTYTSFSHSGWFFLQAEGVNKQGVIVGSYMDSKNKMHGFAYANGKFVTLNFPGANATDALGINDSGEIVGWYLPSGQIYSQGFILVNGQYYTLMVNGKPSISVDAVNNSGHVYGDALGTSFIGKNCQ